jgi:hypothetical protein
MLPPDLVALVVSHLDLHEILQPRIVSAEWCATITADKRWLPLIAPPLYKDASLGVVEHAVMLIQLFARYQSWLARWRSLACDDDNGEPEAALLRLQGSSLDGWFAVGPWRRRADETVTAPGGPWKPLLWLHRSVYGMDPAPMIARTTLVATPSAAPSLRRSARLKPKDAESIASTFYQQRDRDDNDAFRKFYSSPVLPRPAERVRDYGGGSKFRVVVLPLNVRRLDGTPDARLPDHDAGALSRYARTLVDVLGCYIGDVHVEPLEDFNCDIDAHAHVSSQTGLRQIGCHAFRHARRGRPCCGSARDEMFIFLVAPHLKPTHWSTGAPSKSMDWCFSSPLRADAGASTSVPWVISTYQFEAHLGHSTALRARCLAGTVLYCALDGAGLETCCENDMCAMSNCDGVGEGVAGSLLLCAACLRKMQLLNRLRDGKNAQRCFVRLREALSGDDIIAVTRKDLYALRLHRTFYQTI